MPAKSHKHFSEAEKRSARNRDKAKYRANNLEKVREDSRQRTKNGRDADPEKHRTSVRMAHQTRKENGKAEEYKPRHKVIARKFQLKYKFGLTLEDYNSMFDEQQGKCAVCGRHQSELKLSLAVDHNHETGKVRGLLCSGCNTALGMLRENKNSILSMVEYLKRHE